MMEFKQLFGRIAHAILLGLAGVLAANAGEGNAEQDITGRLRTGDLLFQTAGKSEFSEAISDATSVDSISFVHVGIVVVEGDETYVIEASPEYGVRVCPLSDFIVEEGRTFVKRISADYPIEECVERARSFVGQPYDWYYLPDNGMIYCSELVYESYLDEHGHHMFEGSPMNFRAPDGTMPQFWTDLYSRLGVDVPEGIPGTNPNDLSQSSILIEIGKL